MEIELRMKNQTSPPNICCYSFANEIADEKKQVVFFGSFIQYSEVFTSMNFNLFFTYTYILCQEKKYVCYIITEKWEQKRHIYVFPLLHI